MKMKLRKEMETCTNKMYKTPLNTRLRNRINKKRWLERRRLKKRCVQCGVNPPRPNSENLCSDTCVKSRLRGKIKIWNEKLRDRFFAYKESLGCQRCGYKVFGGSLDFHHVNSKTKERSITAKVWKRGDLEIEKCVLLCKNCHSEVHAGRKLPPIRLIDASIVDLEARSLEQAGRFMSNV